MKRSTNILMKTKLNRETIGAIGREFNEWKMSLQEFLHEVIKDA
jgi:hypothetical protein